MQKISFPKGTRDFFSKEIYKRKYLIKIIQNNFERFGFTPIETPSLENLAVLTGKYGAENERLIFKIIKSGDFMKVPIKNFHSQKSILNSFNSKTLIEQISEKALRFDLTVPLARFVAMHKNQICLPFKRYQIQPVWRADRPQAGRFQEFYQCDADVVGSKSIWQEIDMIQLYDAVFSELKLPVNIHINHRDILAGLVEVAGIETLWEDFLTILDKWDKIEPTKLRKKIIDLGVSKKSLSILDILFIKETDFDTQVQKYSKLLSSSRRGKNGLRVISLIKEHLQFIGLKNSELKFNCKLTRGMNYYTGIIFEVFPNGINHNSIGGGGRYDNLTKFWGLKDVSGVGISFGLDRIYLVLEEMGLLKNFNERIYTLLFINFGSKEALYANKCIKRLREYGLSAELYPDPVKIKKQFRYAYKRGLRFIVVIGQEEINKKQIKIKDLKLYREATYPLLGVEKIIKKLIFA